VVELNEKNGGRHQSFVIENEDLVRAGASIGLLRRSRWSVTGTPLLSI